MRRTALTCLGLATLALGSLGASLPACNDATPSSAPGQSEHVIRTGQPIEGGTVDQTDTNVVGILIGSNGQLSSLCSGSLIGPNLILTAHHCVANPPNNLVCGGKFSTTITAANQFAVTTSYNAAEQIWVSSNPKMPTPDGVTWWGVSTVNVPTTNNVCSGDQALLTLSSSITTACPLIPAVDVQATKGEAYTAIGFGITSPNGTVAGTRYELTSGLSVQCVGSAGCGDNTIGATGEWEGGSSSQEGTCEGDSGGPALDASHRIIGTVSRGPGGACNSTVYESTYADPSSPTTNGAWIKTIAAQAATAGGYAAAGWVTGGATSNPANGYPCAGGSSSSSSSSSTSTSTSSSSSSSTSSGSSGTVPTTCTGADGTIGCCVGNTNYYCSSGGKLKSAACPSGEVCGWDATNGYYGCVAPPATSDPSNTYPLLCGGTTSSSSSSTSSSGTTSSSSSSGGGQCAGQTPTGVPACDTCIDNSCCTQYVACGNDTTCVTCEGSQSPPASCASDQAYNDFNNCLATTCASPCSAGSSSSSSGGTGGSGTGGSGAGNSGTGNSGTGNSGTGNSGTGNSGTGGSPFSNGGSGTGASSGEGGSGNGNGNGNAGTGNGVGYGVGNNPGKNSSCNVSSSSGGEPASPASLAGLLLGAALIVSRRRR